ncbi:hypothetical protein HPB50_018338 [Hyalomma asiaticum]|uniref:Uncharacterized protein n=1 Tax=Hyalomma asiaticum TaxID=266040 RepID=A0ACB7RLJ6_HYAAI|nr:hypothetical protein HPB50_018338 [Hyalomma asiaticum]
MPDRGPVRFSGYPVEGVVGVNWRLTRLVGEVPSARVCGLCRVVPYRILWLPCGHSMCQSCCSANSQDAERRCPLDQKQFDNFGSSVLTENEAKTLKVHCWNEPHGCKFEGNMGNMLEHYEKQCTAHTVECLRCGNSVPHTEISTHYMAGCTVPASGFAGELFPSPESASLPLGDVNATDEELEALLREPMSEIQSQMKELMEHVSSQQSKLTEITRDVAAVEHNLKAEMDQVAARICSALSDQLRSQRIPAEEPGASAHGTLQETSEKMLILRKLEIFADMSLSTMENLRQQSLWQRDPGRVTALCEPQVRDCRYRHLTKARATSE